MAKFGIVSQGSLANLIGVDQLHLCGTFQPSSTGTLTSFDAWLSAVDEVADQACKFALLTNKAGPYPDALVSGSDTVAQTVPQPSAMTKYTVVCTGSPTVTAGTDYWLAILTDATNASIQIAYENGVGDLKYGSRTYASGFPATLAAGFSDIAFQYSIAANYTPQRNIGAVRSGLVLA